MSDENIKLAISSPEPWKTVARKTPNDGKECMGIFTSDDKLVVLPQLTEFLDTGGKNGTAADF